MGEDMGSREAAFERKKKKKKKMRDAKCHHSSVILRNYIAQDMLLTRIYKDVITRVGYEHIKNKSFLLDA